MESLDWSTLRVLVAIERTGSLRGAAREVGLSQPTLGRRVRDLEAQLKTPVLVRHARGVRFTEAGLALLQVARGLEERLNDTVRVLAGARQAVRGRVRVGCTEAVAMHVLPSALSAIRHEHQELSVDVVVDAHASDLDRRDADVAIRMFQPRRPNLVARKLGEAGTAFYASLSYVEAHGRPDSLDALLEHAVIGPDRDPLFVEAAQNMGFPLERCAYRTDSFASTLAWTRAGIAIGALLTTLGDDDPDLVRLFPPIQRFPVWLVTHPDLFGSAPVKAVWDALIAHLGPVFASEEPGPG